MKTIYINGRFLTQNLTGVQRYCIEIVKELDKLDSPNIKYILLLPKSSNIVDAHFKLRNIKINRIGIFSGHLWEQIDLFFYTFSETLFSPNGTGPIFKRKHLPTFHDVNFIDIPDGFTDLFAFWYRIVFSASGFFSKQILTVSEYSKQRIQSLLKVSPQKISVVYEGYQHMIDIPPDFSILNRLNQNIPYILAVSSLNTNKNFKLIINCIEAVCDLGLQIVIVGGSNPTVFKGKNKLSGKKNFVWLGRVSDNELKALYTNAFCFVYPSFFEGFGLPPLEAQACGSFCIISSTSCLPEIYSDSVLYCDPHEKETLIEAITLLKDDESKRNLLKDKMEENLTKYSWKESAVKIHYLLNFKQ